MLNEYLGYTVARGPRCLGATGVAGWLQCDRGERLLDALRARETSPRAIFSKTRLDIYNFFPGNMTDDRE